MIWRGFVECKAVLREFGKRHQAFDEHITEFNEEAEFGDSGELGTSTQIKSCSSRTCKPNFVRHR